MKVLRQLPITNLSVQFAEPVKDNKIKVYRVSVAKNIIDNQHPCQKLEKFLGEKIMVIPSTIGLKSGIDLQSHNLDLDEGVNAIVHKALTKNVVDTTLFQTVERNYYGSSKFEDLLGQLVGFIRGKILFKNVGGIKINRLALGKNVILTKIASLLEKIEYKNCAPMRKAYPVQYISFVVEEEDLQLGIDRVANSIFNLRDNIKASMTSSIKSMELPDTVGDGIKRFAVFAFVHLDMITYSLLTQLIKNNIEPEAPLIKLGIVNEGETGSYLSKNDPKKYEIETINVA